MRDFIISISSTHDPMRCLYTLCLHHTVSWVSFICRSLMALPLIMVDNDGRNGRVDEWMSKCVDF